MNKFAITIPNLNQSRFLATVLESIRCQRRPFDLSIMDGGSEDNFFDVITRYRDIIGYWRSRKDSGQSAAISDGWKYVDGNILCWINADDYYFPNCFKIVDKIFNRKKDVDVVYGDAVHVDAEGQFISYFPAIKKYDRQRIGYDCFICQPACFIKKEVYQEIKGIQKKLIYTMDWDLWCQLSKIGAKFEYVNEPLAAVRYYKGTKTLTPSISRYIEILRIENKYSKRLLPLSVLGADYYGMTLNKEHRFLSNSYKIIYDLMRKINSDFFSYRNIRKNCERAPLYGIERLGNKVHGECKIHIPWYSTHDWKTIIIYADEKPSNLSIEVNGKFVEGHEHGNGEIHIGLLSQWRPCIKMAIKSIKQNTWHLNQVKCN